MTVYRVLEDEDYKICSTKKKEFPNCDFFQQKIKYRWRAEFVSDILTFDKCDR